MTIRIPTKPVQVPAGSAARKGVTSVEGAIVLSVFFVVCFALFDLGLATFRYNAIGAAARGIAREAIVRGSRAAPERSAWGPMAYAGTAADGDEIASVASPLLPTMPRAGVTITVTWPDGDNEEDSRVHVRVGYVHRPFLPLLTLGESLDLQAESAATIAH